MTTISQKAVNFTEFTKEHKLSREDLVSTIHQIGNFARANEKEKNKIDFDFESVYVKKGKEKMELILTLGERNKDFSFELSKFLIRLLRRIDVGDKAALRLAYGMFVKSSKQNYKIEELEELADEIK